MSSNPKITEHALIRYMERVKGIDVEAMRKEVTDNKIVEQIDVLGSGTFPCGDYKIVVRDSIIVTVLCNEKPV